MNELKPVPDRAVEPSEMIHSPFYPENLRNGEPIRVDLVKSGSEQSLGSFRVWKLSPLGIEVIAEKALGGLETSKIDIATKLDLRIHYGSGIISHSGLLVASTQETEKGWILGIRWASQKMLADPNENRRKNRRWYCGNEFLPTGIAANPLRFNDFIHFQVADFSSTGMKIQTSMRNKLLVPGMKLESIVTFPMLGQVTVHFEIKHAQVIDRSGKYFLALGCQFSTKNERLNELIAQHLIQFATVDNLTALRESGLNPRSLGTTVTFSSVRTEDEYRQVLRLRREAWMASGVAQQSTDEDFADKWDARARILTATYNGKVIASLRILFPDEDGALEHETHCKVPSDLPRGDELVEITRVVVDPNFRRSDLLLGLFHRAVIACLQSGRRYILGNSDKKLLPLYRGLGFQILDVRFQNAKLGVDGNLFIGDIHSAILGRSVGPVPWNLLFSDLVRYLRSVSTLIVDPMSRIRMAVYRLFWPIAVLAKKRMDGHKSPAKRPPAPTPDLKKAA